MLANSSWSVAALLALSHQVLAQNATTITSAGCVNPSGFKSCITDANNKESTCINEAGGNNELIIGCGWQKDVNELMCYMSDCWNKVYSCEYQYIASSYLIQRTTQDTIPFYPAPNDAPGGCSCNMGDIFKNATASIKLISSKCKNYQLSLSSELSDCQCCAWSAALSSFYGICPKTDPSQLGIDRLAAEVKDYTTIAGSCTNLNSDTCLGEFGIGSADGTTYVDPNNLPAGGTDPLSTTTGVGYPLTSPPGPATMTVTLLDATYTITAAAYTATNGDSSSSTTSSSGSGSGTGSGPGSGAGSSSSSGSGSSATASASAKGNAGVSTFSAPPLVAYIALLFYICVASL